MAESTAEWTPNELRLVPRFDEALRLREEERYQEAIDILASVVESLEARDVRLLTHSHLQIAYICELLGNEAGRERHFSLATRVAPNYDLASLGLFHTLMSQRRFTEGLQEMLRYLTIKDAPDYVEMLADEVFGSDLLESDRELVKQARLLVKRRREMN
ncbi:MAG: hypothetical protein H0T79_16580 [Deltaproteobacteria bacterium]|nr:hypothetical protein [Deltaproteobacteria bacterium]